MKLVIFAGGSGTVEIQKELSSVFKNNLDYTVVINALDNGLSTGVVRQVVGGNILGPSDVRKNQLLRHKLIHGETALYKFLNSRVTDEPQVVKNYLLDKIDELVTSGDLFLGTGKILNNYIKQFFSFPEAYITRYEDFSVANILYAGAASMHRDSLSVATEQFESILDIPKDSVVIVSDTNAYLHAMTESGYEIRDEGDIATWGKCDDKIVSAHFVDSRNIPVSREISKKAKDIISSADFFIFAAGSQWSSLIPTYMTDGFGDLIRSLKTPGLLFMNVEYHKDIYGYTGDGLIDKISEHLPMEHIEVVNSSNGNMLLHSPSFHNTVVADVSNPNDNKHDPEKWCSFVMKRIYGKYAEADHILFDYDDTIAFRNPSHRDFATNVNNCEYLAQLAEKRSVSICTGNTIKALTEFTKVRTRANLRVYADCALNEYTLHTGKTSGTGVDFDFIKCLNPDYLISSEAQREIINMITSCGICSSKVIDKHGSIIAIKPIPAEYRTAITQLMNFKLAEIFGSGNRFVAIAVGTSTIEIRDKNLQKDVVMNEFSDSIITYVGDELHEGNDACFTEYVCVNPLTIRDPRDTLVFLMALNTYF